jgi:DNA-directed RNA polymerase specialized sigma24 family protein
LLCGQRSLATITEEPPAHSAPSSLEISEEIEAAAFHLTAEERVMADLAFGHDMKARDVAEFVGLKYKATCRKLRSLRGCLAVRRSSVVRVA